jgi:hypothetical protein
MSKFSILFAAAFLVACSDGGPATGPELPPPQSFTITGAVRDAADNQPITNATVQIGNRSTTSGPNGQYQLTNVIVNPKAGMQVTAAGYQSFVDTIAAGRTTVDVTLTRQTIYQSGQFAMYLTPGVSTYRGVLLYLPFLTMDARPFILTQETNSVGEPKSPADVMAEWNLARALAQKHGLAIVASDHVWYANTATAFQEPTTPSVILNALSSFAQLSGRTELATAPLLLSGGSGGACAAYAFARVQSARMIGLLLDKYHSANACAFPADPRTLGVPAYFIVGSFDTGARQTMASFVFEPNRAAAAPWALVLEAGAEHTRVSAIQALYNWSDAILALRLPAAGSTSLRPVALESGWLGDRTTFAASPYANFTGNKESASWLPNQQTVQDWLRLSGR